MLISIMQDALTIIKFTNSNSIHYMSEEKNTILRNQRLKLFLKESKDDCSRSVMQRI